MDAVVHNLFRACICFLCVFATNGAPTQEIIERQSVPEDYDLKVVILGSGTPSMSAPATKFGASILVEAKGKPYIFDCGRGCAMRLHQVYETGSAGIADTLFLTHLHSDHTTGIPELYVNGWIGRSTPFRVWGPAEKALAMMTHIRAAYQADFEMRGGDRRPNAAQFQVMDVSGNGVVLEEDGVTVTAFLVSHYAQESFGYRLDYNGRSVVISGDTGPSENLVEHARGADLLLHEVMSPITEASFRARGAEGAIRAHVTAEQAGEIFSSVAPRMAAYYHYNEDIEDPSETILIGRTRQTYTGPLVLGHDLMTFLIGDEISVIAGR